MADDVNDWEATRRSLEEAGLLRNPFTNALRAGNTAPPPGWLAQEILPGSAAPPPGYLATSVLPGGAAPPVSASPSRGLEPANSPLNALRTQMNTINDIVGPAPVMPVVRDQLTASSPTAGLMALGSHGGMVGNQTPSQVVPHQGDLENMRAYNTALNGRSQDISQLLGRLGTMGAQNIAQQGENRQLLALTHPTGGELAVRTPDREFNRQNWEIYRQGLISHQASGGSMQSWDRQWRATGRQVPTDPSIQRNPAVRDRTTGEVRTTGDGGEITPSGESVFGENQDIYNNAAGYNNQTRIPSRGIGEFLSHLDSTHPGHIQNNWSTVQSYIRDRWGDVALNDAMQRAQDPQQLNRGNNLPQALLRLPINVFQGTRQIMSGPNQEEIGLSQLGNFLRQQQANPRNAPPIPGGLRGLGGVQAPLAF